MKNMAVGASSADAAVLVVSAARGEFETGFDAGGTKENPEVGMTREEALLAFVPLFTRATINTTWFLALRCVASSACWLGLVLGLPVSLEAFSASTIWS